jgi:tyrosyl-tRNA synthetase
MTYHPKSDFMAVIMERGFLADCTDYQGLDEALSAGPVTAYIGYDATARSLHVGHLLNIMLLRWFQKTGHRPITLMGGGTTKVGDPSFRSEERPLLGPAEIAANIAAMKRVFARYLAYGGGVKDAAMLDNADWLDGLNYLDFLRDIGRHFSVNRMLSFESVKSRLDREQSLSFLEFNYMIMQGYDFTELNRRYDCILQMGGSDQWGNIVNGLDLSHKMGGPQLYALTTPLLTTSSGQKMGKTAQGAVWLNDDLFSAYDFWQYFRNTEDADVERFLKIFTRLPLDEIAKLAALKDTGINEAKKVLATEATAVVHGRDAAEQAAETARKTFEEGALSENLPTIEVPTADLSAGMGLLNLLVAAGLATSNGEARRHVKGGAVRVNDSAVSDERLTVDEGAVADGVVKLSVGKKKHVLVRPV